MLWAGSRYPGGYGGGSPSPRWHLTGTGPRRGCDEPGCLRGWVAAAGRGVPPRWPHRTGSITCRGGHVVPSRSRSSKQRTRFQTHCGACPPAFPNCHLHPTPQAPAPTTRLQQPMRREARPRHRWRGAGLEDAGRLPAVECVLGRASGRPPPGAVRVRAVVSGVQAWCEPGSLQLKLCINPL